MFRFLFRSIGLICLAAAFVLVVVDGMRSIIDSRVSITSARTLWELLNASGLAKLKPLLEPYAGGLLWDLMDYILAAPSWALLGGFGILLLVFGRRKKPLIGFER
jgi:hypothetical protein